MKKRNFLSIIVLLSMIISANDVFADDIYVAGTILGSFPTYWKNGTEIVLHGGTAANSIFVAGSDVYIAGSSEVGPVYWKNAGAQGDANKLFEESSSGSVLSVFVSGSDVYFAGYELDEKEATYIAKYWKNGKSVVLPSEKKNAAARSIFVSGSAVYAAGYIECGEEYEGEYGIENYSVAAYWKNGKLVKLTGGKSNATARSITVVGDNVYVAGFEYDGTYVVAKYWKNGTEVKLTDGKHISMAYSIAVSGSDVYVAGRQHNGNYWVATYWKNGVAVSLPDTGNGSSGISIVLSGSDVYVVGSIWITEDTINAVYWLNGKLVNLEGEHTPSYADSIFVVKK